MKTAMTVKLIFESDEVRDFQEPGDLPEFTLLKMRELINNADNDLTIECILDNWGTNQANPILIIHEEKRKETE